MKTKSISQRHPCSAPREPGQKVERPEALFRRIDWLAFGIGTFLVLLGYLLTVAPNVTLEDSGELAIGSMYAGVPHPPGYPVWTLYTWLFTKLLPFSNIAWRVAVASSVAGALACGLIALVVSRGSSLLLRGMSGTKEIERRAETLISLTAGVVAATLMGFNGYMWSQSVIVEVYSLSVLSLMGVVCYLMCWVYAPHQRRYLYWSCFLFGICLTNHMSLLVAAVGIQIAVAAADKKVGRDFLLVNGLVYLGVLLTSKVSEPKLGNEAISALFHLVGVGSIILCGWLAFKTEKLLTEWKVLLFSGLAFVTGAAFYFYMPLASMSNPPMNWGYARTAEGFMHAIKREQYSGITPVNISSIAGAAVSPWKEQSRATVSHFAGQLALYAEGARQEFSPVLLLVALLPLLLLRKMQDRERAWIIGLSAIWWCLSLLLLLLLNPGLDRQSIELHRVFFTASHVVLAILIGYGLAFLAARLLCDYTRYRKWALVGAIVAVGLALHNLTTLVGESFADISFLEGIIRVLRTGENILSTTGGLLLLTLTLGFLGLLLFCRQRIRLSPMLFLFLLCPAYSIVSHWQDNEQKGHLFGYWFGHDMFIPPFEAKNGNPIYPEMAKDAVLFGGTDPGRFNPTYMIFGESFTAPNMKVDPKFDRRDVYLITQNALADGTYLSYIRAHYNRSTQKDPPFFQNYFNKPFLRGLMPAWKILDNTFDSLGEKIEKERRIGTSWFEKNQFTDIENLQRKLSQQEHPFFAYLFAKLSPKTKSLLSEQYQPALAQALAEDLNRLIETERIYLPARFDHIKLSEHSRRFIKEDPKGHTLVRWNRLLLEDVFPEIARSEAGLYPDIELKTPSPEDHGRAMEAYTYDAQRRLQVGQLRPGEEVKIVNGRLQVSGTIAVMAINGMLTKSIFDTNPDHEFYVEESFPLDWMFPHLTPYGIIMKINRQAVPVITNEIAQQDHQFWRQYSNRLVGDWITYDTSVKEICDFSERLYLHHDYRGFNGDRKFIRDDNAQKAFSKLRSSIGGTYLWRLGYMGMGCPPQFSARKNLEEHQRVLKEAEFALKQSFAFCPYSPEAISRFAQFLLAQQRADDAILIVKTGLKFDPGNQYVAGLLQQLESIKQSRKNQG